MIEIKEIREALNDLEGGGLSIKRKHLLDSLDSMEEVEGVSDSFDKICKGCGRLFPEDMLDHNASFSHKYGLGSTWDVCVECAIEYARSGQFYSNDNKV